jgi:hypothetical protein
MVITRIGTSFILKKEIFFVNFSDLSLTSVVPDPMDKVCKLINWPPEVRSVILNYESRSGFLLFIKDSKKFQERISKCFNI